MGANQDTGPEPAGVTVIDAEADRRFKGRHRALWASGDYPRVAAELIPDLGARLVRACGVTAGQRVLDVAAGSGNAAIPAAEAGAQVTASDLTPELFAAGRRAAAARGVDLDWVEADAEALPFDTGTFDVVLSCVGAMFAPRHRIVADELVRVCRPGGTLGMVNWTPEGFVGQLLRALSPYAPPPPPGAAPPPLWGTEEHVRDLFGDRVTDLDLRRRQVVFERSESPESFREYWRENYGPTRAVYASTASDPDRVAALDRAFLDVLRTWNRGGADAALRYEAEYLLVTARTRAGSAAGDRRPERTLADGDRGDGPR
ncbi:MAG: class I SAM-dependent methyltransferase [Pseudonocardia sp.]|nr:class I SAM-dependent methyltransferase [Pseudonocardia sp.]